MPWVFFYMNVFINTILLIIQKHIMNYVVLAFTVQINMCTKVFNNARYT